jgi:outer membrane protein assembly factor BamB
VIAFDRRTGRTVWSTLKLQRRTSYATPLVASIPGRSPQLICSSGGMGVASLDPYTGRLNWMTGELPARTVASPIFSGELIIQPCGGGGVGKHLVAVDPFTDPASADKRIRYTREKNLPYVPTPISYGDHLYLWNDNGVVNCVETATGDNVWTKRVGGKYTGSPICVDGKIYIMSETGQVAVVSASPEYKFYGKSQLDDPSHSTPAVAGGRLYLRTFHRLACLEGRP